jgi:hypothetical protein
MGSNTTVYFHDTNLTPPGGFFCEVAGEKVTGRTFIEIEPKVRALMTRHNIPGLPEALIASYMCPRLDDPGRYCKGETVPVQHTRPREAFEKSVAYTRKPVVSFDKIERREIVCTKCPKHQRHWCPTCSGHPAKLSAMFAGRRPDLPVDKVTGVCECAKAYEYAITSVEYGKDEKIWEGAPETCWRYNDV